MTCPKCSADITMMSGNSNMCQACRRDYDRKRYSAQRAKRKAQILASQQRNRDKNRQAVWNYLVEHACLECGESDPIVLEFDHVRGEKVGNISELCVRRSLAVTFAEIEKCEVVCANCHRRRTARRGNWYERLKL